VLPAQPEARRARFSDLVVSSLNPDNPLIWPDSIPVWLRPTVIRRVAIVTNDERPRVLEQSNASQRHSLLEKEMNPGSIETFQNSKVTGLPNDHSMNGGKLPVHQLGRHNVSSSSNPYLVNMGSGGEVRQVRQNLYTIKVPSLSVDLPSSITRVVLPPVNDKVTSSDDWIVQLGDKLVIKTISKAVGPGGSYRKRMARLRYGFRKIAPKLKLPYCLVRDILGSSLLAVKRATTMSSNTDEMISALHESSRSA
jgi:hypothetical protein